VECANIRKEFPETKFEPCCVSCHEDEEEGFGSDLWFNVDGKDRHICCAMIKILDGKVKAERSGK
jgi:hypothetical protein